MFCFLWAYVVWIWETLQPTVKIANHCVKGKLIFKWCEGYSAFKRSTSWHLWWAMLFVWKEQHYFLSQMSNCHCFRGAIYMNDFQCFRNVPEMSRCQCFSEAMRRTTVNVAKECLRWSTVSVLEQCLRWTTVNVSVECLRSTTVSVSGDCLR